jgi:hypothetical protein
MVKNCFSTEVQNLVTYDFSEFVYKDNKTKSTVICKKHQIKFHRNLKQIRKGILCTICSDKITTNLNFINKSKRIWSENKWDYSKTMYTGNRNKIKIVCKKHGYEFEVYPNQHLKLQKDCVYCKQEKMSLDFINKSKEIWGNRLDYSSLLYKNNKTNVTLICKKHGEFKQRPDNHLFNMNGCPSCNKSKGEIIISNFLDKNGIEYIFQKRFQNCVNKYQLRFDFYLPVQNKCIEYNGEQHYEKVNFFGGDKTLKYNKKRDNIKLNFCIDNDIELIIIKYNESIENKLNFLISNDIT